MAQPPVTNCYHQDAVQTCNDTCRWPWQKSCFLFELFDNLAWNFFSRCDVPLFQILYNAHIGIGIYYCHPWLPQGNFFILCGWRHWSTCRAIAETGGPHIRHVFPFSSDETLLERESVWSVLPQKSGVYHDVPLKRSREPGDTHRDSEYRSSGLFPWKNSMRCRMKRLETAWASEAQGRTGRMERIENQHPTVDFHGGSETRSRYQRLCWTHICTYTHIHIYIYIYTCTIYIYIYTIYIYITILYI